MEICGERMILRYDNLMRPIDEIGSIEIMSINDVTVIMKSSIVRVILK